MLLNRKVISVAFDPTPPGLFKVTTHSGKNDVTVLTCQDLVLTMPLPQSMALLEESNFPFDLFDKRGELLLQMQAKQYHPCICLIVVVKVSDHAPAGGKGVWRLEPSDVKESTIVQWISSNRRKGIKVEGDYEGSDLEAFTIHCAPNFSRTNYDKINVDNGDDTLVDLIISDAEALSKGTIRASNVIVRDVKKWRYSIPVVSSQGASLLEKEGFIGLNAEPGNRLVFAGDSFSQHPRIEACYLSAQKSVHFLNDQ